MENLINSYLCIGAGIVIGLGLLFICWILISISAISDEREGVRDA